MTHFLVNQTGTLVQESSAPREGGPIPAQKEGLMFSQVQCPMRLPRRCGEWERTRLPMQEPQETTPGSGRFLGGRTATHSSVFAWKIPWTGSLVGYSPWAHEASDMAEQLDAQAQGAPWLLPSAPLGGSRAPTHLPAETLRPEGMFAGSFGGKFPHLEKRLTKRRRFFPWILSCLNLVPGNSVAILETKI